MVDRLPDTGRCQIQPHGRVKWCTSNPGKVTLAVAFFCASTRGANLEGSTSRLPVNVGLGTVRNARTPAPSVACEDFADRGCNANCENFRGGSRGTNRPILVMAPFHPLGYMYEIRPESAPLPGRHYVRYRTESYEELDNHVAWWMFVHISLWMCRTLPGPVPKEHGPAMPDNAIASLSGFFYSPCAGYKGRTAHWSSALEWPPRGGHDRRGHPLHGTTCVHFSGP